MLEAASGLNTAKALSMMRIRHGIYVQTQWLL